MVYRPNEPYNDLPPLPPAHDLETRPVMRRCVAASWTTGRIQTLAEIGVLVVERRGRQVIYRHPACLEVLTA